jgi:hypothetical protein
VPATGDVEESCRYVDADRVADEGADVTGAEPGCDLEDGAAAGAGVDDDLGVGEPGCVGQQPGRTAAPTGTR